MTILRGSSWSSWLTTTATGSSLLGVSMKGLQLRWQSGKPLDVGLSCHSVPNDGDSWMSSPSIAAGHYKLLPSINTHGPWSSTTIHECYPWEKMNKLVSRDWSSALSTIDSPLVTNWLAIIMNHQLAIDEQSWNMTKLNLSKIQPLCACGSRCSARSAPDLAIPRCHEMIFGDAYRMVKWCLNVGLMMGQWLFNSSI